MAEKITSQGLEKLENEKKQLIIEKEQATIRLREARELGDLSENAEYDSAREQLELITARIDKINQILSDYELIDVAKISKDNIQVGCFVRIQDIEEDEVLEYQIVGSSESSLEEGKLNMESPLAQAIIGKKKGDLVVFDAPIGRVSVKILKIGIEGLEN